MPGYLSNLATRGTAVLPTAKKRVFAGMPKGLRNAGPQSLSAQPEGMHEHLPARASRSAEQPAIENARQQSTERQGFRETEREQVNKPLHAEIAPVRNNAASNARSSMTALPVTGTEAAAQGPAFSQQEAVRTVPPAASVQDEVNDLPISHDPVPRRAEEARSTLTSTGPLFKRPPIVEVSSRADVAAAETLTKSVPQREVRQLKRPPIIETVRSPQPGRVEAGPVPAKVTEEHLGFMPHRDMLPELKRDSKAQHLGVSLSHSGTPTPRASLEVPQGELTQHRESSKRFESPYSSASSANRPVVGHQKKQEGPRLNIGRLEIQIIQENQPANAPRRDGNRSTPPDAWQHVDRQHIGQLGGA